MMNKIIDGSYGYPKIYDEEEEKEASRNERRVRAETIRRSADNCNVEIW